MTHINVNPYASPESGVDISTRQQSSRSLTLMMASAICSLAFVTFTILLLRSSPVDRTAGLLFLVNIPVLLGLVIVLARSTYFGIHFSLAAACVQGAITVAMLWMKVGDAPVVVGINTLIILPLLVIAFGSWQSSRHIPLTRDTPSPDGE